VPVSFLGVDRRLYVGQRSDRIQLPDRASFHSPLRFCSTLGHEQIHSTGHEFAPEGGIWAVSSGRLAMHAKELVRLSWARCCWAESLEIGSEIESHADYLATGSRCLQG